MSGDSPELLISWSVNFDHMSLALAVNNGMCGWPWGWGVLPNTQCSETPPSPTAADTLDIMGNSGSTDHFSI